MFEKGGYELDFGNVRVILLSAWYVNGMFGKIVYLYCATAFFVFGLVETRHASVYRNVKRLTDKIAQKLSVNVSGIEFKPMDFLSIPIVAPVFEDWAWTYLKVKEDDVVVDLGAHIGKYACTIAKLVGTHGRVIAVEANPANYVLLVKNALLNKLENVVALNLAAYDRDCEIRLFDGANSSGRSSIKLDNGVGSVMVQARALDTVPELTSLRRIDFVKVDVEGAEYEAIVGMSKLLRLHKPSLLLEVWDFGKLRPLLLRLGYTRVTLDPHRRGYYFVSQ